MTTAGVTYRRIPHAAHYSYGDSRVGHDLEQWDSPDVGRHTGSGSPKRADGVPVDAQYHSGYIAKDGAQRWVFVRRAPLSEAPTCLYCTNKLRVES